MSGLRLLGVITGVAVICISSVCGQCPAGFVHQADSCYHFSHDAETWFDALVTCEKVFKGHLAEIHDTNEDQFLSQRVQSEGVPYWIGGSDLQVEGEWHWQSTNEMLSYVGHWRSGNPSNDGGQENCLELNTHSRSEETRWNDVNCHVTRLYICEKPALSPAPVLG